MTRINPPTFGESYQMLHELDQLPADIKLHLPQGGSDTATISTQAAQFKQRTVSTIPTTLETQLQRYIPFFKNFAQDGIVTSQGIKKALHMALYSRQVEKYEEPRYDTQLTEEDRRLISTARLQGSALALESGEVRTALLMEKLLPEDYRTLTNQLKLAHSGQMHAVSLTQNQLQAIKSNIINGAKCADARTIKAMLEAPSPNFSMLINHLNAIVATNEYPLFAEQAFIAISRAMTTANKSEYWPLMQNTYSSMDARLQQRISYRLQSMGLLQKCALRTESSFEQALKHQSALASRLNSQEVAAINEFLTLNAEQLPKNYAANPLLFDRLALFLSLREDLDVHLSIDQFLNATQHNDTPDSDLSIYLQHLQDAGAKQNKKMLRIVAEPCFKKLVCNLPALACYGHEGSKNVVDQLYHQTLWHPDIGLMLDTCGSLNRLAAVTSDNKLMHPTEATLTLNSGVLTHKFRTDVKSAEQQLGHLLSQRSPYEAIQQGWRNLVASHPLIQQIQRQFTIDENDMAATVTALKDYVFIARHRASETLLNSRFENKAQIKDAMLAIHERLSASDKNHYQHVVEPLLKDAEPFISTVVMVNHARDMAKTTLTNEQRFAPEIMNQRLKKLNLEYGGHVTHLGDCGFDAIGCHSGQSGERVKASLAQAASDIITYIEQGHLENDDTAYVTRIKNVCDGFIKNNAQARATIEQRKAILQDFEHKLQVADITEHWLDGIDDAPLIYIATGKPVIVLSYDDQAHEYCMSTLYPSNDFNDVTYLAFMEPAEASQAVDKAKKQGEPIYLIHNPGYFAPAVKAKPVHRKRSPQNTPVPTHELTRAPSALQSSEHKPVYTGHEKPPKITLQETITPPALQQDKTSQPCVEDDLETENKLQQDLDKEIHKIATTVEKLSQEIGSEDEDAENFQNVPYDSNLTCPVCSKGFRYGQIQHYRKHVKDSHQRAD